MDKKSRKASGKPTRATRGHNNSITAPEGGKDPEGSPDRPCWWAITINNPTPSDCYTWNNLMTRHWVKDFGGQLEVAPTTGTEHIQGWLHTNAVRFAQIKKVFPRANIQYARSHAALQKYCAKPGGKPIPEGEAPVTLEDRFNSELLYRAAMRVSDPFSDAMKIYIPAPSVDGKIEWHEQEQNEDEILGYHDDWITPNRDYFKSHAGEIIQTAVEILVEAGYPAEHYLNDTPGNRARKTIFPSILIRLKKEQEREV